MKALRLFLILALGFCPAVKAQVFDIPKIGGITIDGKSGDWGDKGFRVDAMSAESGMTREPGNFDPRFRLGWDDRGLLVLVMVRDDQIAEADTAGDIHLKDSVEMYFGTLRGTPQYFQIVTGTGADPKFPTLRTFLIDRRSPVPSQKLEVEAAGGRTTDGYVVEARLPWSNLAINPRAGAESAFQLYVNDVDGAGSRLLAAWFPSNDTYRDPKRMFRLRLATKASPPMQMSAWPSVEHGRLLVDVTAPAEFIGKAVSAKVGEKLLATGIFCADAGRAHAVCVHVADFPLQGDIEISSTAGGNLPVACDFDAAIARSMDEATVVFRPSVFNGEKFPPCDFEQPAETEKLLGKCVLTPTFYDADFHEVKVASKPGRYGAIVEVATANRRKFKRFVTLYRTAQDLSWRLQKMYAQSVQFPPELGLDPAVVAERNGDVNTFLQDQVTGGLKHGSEAAVLFAALREMKPGGAPPRQRNGPYALDQKWWAALKKQTGNLREDFYVHLPKSYDSDPQKKWPLILFLHGSGERGYGLDSLKRNGLPFGLDAKPDFPFVFVAPQCSPGEWWSPTELNGLLDRVIAKYRVDADRIYLTGLSMGGFGSWDLAIDSPQRFAAVVPLCGGGDPEDVARIKNIPIWVFHGGKDPVIPLQRSREMVDALKKIGGNVKFTIFPEAQHDCWTQAYSMPELYEWLLQQHREGGK